MRTNPFPESYRRTATRPRAARRTPLSSASSGECSVEEYHPPVTVHLLYEKFLLSKQRKFTNTNSWSSCVPRGQRSKAKVPNKLILMIDHIAEEISDQNSPAESSTVLPRAQQKARKRKTKCKGKDECSDSEVIVPRHTHFRGRVRRSLNKGSTITGEREKLDSATFLRYFMHIWSSFPEDKVESVTYFDPLWLDLYANQNNSAMVLKWIKEKDIFSKKYVLVPIVMWSHWSLLIFCHLGESLESKINTPCMLLLDSLQAIGPTRLEPSIRRLVSDIYQSEGRQDSYSQLKKMCFLIPKVPQQKKGADCGFYILYFIKLFLESAPENFDIHSGYPYFMTKDWFGAEEMESFCRRLGHEVPVVSDGDDGCAGVESNDDDVVLIE